MHEPTGTRYAKLCHPWSPVPGPGFRRVGERGAALVTVLILIIVLTLVGVAMVNVALTEISIAYNQGDAAAAEVVAEAGVARAVYELGVNPAWAGVTAAIGDGQYQVTMASTGTVRIIDSLGTRGGGRQRLRVAVKALPQYMFYAVLANTTAALGSAAPGAVIRNAWPSADAGAVHASNRLAAATAITINPAGATVVGGVTANGAIAGIACLTWPWRCSAAFGVLPFPRLDVDSAAPTSFENRARTAIDPVDGENLYFRGGDATSRCNSGGAWTFGNQETQRCWDKYVNDRGGVVGQGITSPVFFLEFNTGESTSYVLPPPGPPTTRTVDCVGLDGVAETLCIRSMPATRRGACPPPALPCGIVEYANSALRQVTGTIVTFRRGAGTTVVGDIALENVALRSANYSHTSLAGDPAFLAAGQVLAISSGAAAAQRTVTIRGYIYTLARVDNPDGANNLQGSPNTGIDIQHGASLVVVVIEGIVMSNGRISIQDTAANTGTVAVEYDSAAVDVLPAVFTAAVTGRIIVPISWSSGD